MKTNRNQYEPVDPLELKNEEPEFVCHECGVNCFDVVSVAGEDYCLQCAVAEIAYRWGNLNPHDAGQARDALFQAANFFDRIARQTPYTSAQALLKGGR